jgi:CubicO group peptidase (beta-lactamase class C family)
MSTTTKKTSNILKKAIRFFLFTLLALLIVVNLFIVLSGRYYIYTGIRHTYLVGQSGPSIYELDVFPHTSIEKADQTSKWIPASNFNKKELNALDLSFMNDLQTRAYLVFKGDSIVFEKYFDKHDINTVSNSFSAAKTVVALLIGIAVEEGKIKSLDEPVGNYIKEFNSQGKEKITIRHLLWMASGLDWEESSSNPLSENAESYYGTDLYGLVTRQKAISQPGKMFNYQSGNSQLLGYVVEKATGKSVAEYTQEKIWKRIGTEHEAFWSLDKENGDEKAFCCLYATARDFGRLGKLILQQGKWGDQQVVPLWYMKELSKNPNLTTEEGVPNRRYGLHIWTYDGEKDPVIYCRGIKGQYIVAIPKENLVIVRLGLKRNDNFVIPEEKKNDKEYCKSNEAKIGHPTDFFEFLRIGRSLVSRKQ